MTAIDPAPKPPNRSSLSPAVGMAIVFALAIGGLLQEVRWRGGFSGFIASPVESPAQQLKLAELAFKNGNDAVALNLFDRLAAENNSVAQYWLAHMTELGLGVPKDIPKAISLYEKAAAKEFNPGADEAG